MFRYKICNYADAELFHKQCRALEKHIPELEAEEILEDVDGTQVQKYHHPRGMIKVKSDMQVDVLYVEADFDLLPYFNKN